MSQDIDFAQLKCPPRPSQHPPNCPVENSVGNPLPDRVFHNRWTSLKRKVGTGRALVCGGCGNPGLNRKLGWRTEPRFLTQLFFDVTNLKKVGGSTTEPGPHRSCLQPQRGGQEPSLRWHARLGESAAAGHCTAAGEGSLWRDGTSPAAFRCGGARGGLACNHREHPWVHAAVWRRVKPTPLFPELVFETQRFPRRIPSESAAASSESVRKADSNTPMAGWRRSAGRRVVQRITASSAAFSNGVDWGGQAELAARTAIAGRTSREPPPSGETQGRTVTTATPRGCSTEHSG